MWQVNAGIAEADSGVASGQKHIGTRFVVGRVFHRTDYEAGDHPQGLERPDVADRIRALIRRPQQWTLGKWPLGERNRRVGLNGVAQNVQSARGCHLRWHCASVVWIQQSQSGLQTAVGNPGFCVQFAQVKDADASCLASSSGRRWDRYQRFQRPWYRQTLADWRVYVIQEIRWGKGRVKIHGFGGIDR